MAQSVAEFVWQRLHDWGVRRIFGYPGDGINGLVGALDKMKDQFEFVQVRHEEMAAFMASAHAKFTGELGVCLATSGPGATHLLTGLYDARLDHMPVLAITGQQARTAIGAHYQQELDMTSLFKDVAGSFTGYAMVPAQVRHLVDRAVRIAKGRSRVTALVFPNDLQEVEMEEPPRKHGAVFSGIGWSRPNVIPKREDLDRAAEVLNSGKKVAMLVGAGCKGAIDQCIAIADKLNAGCAKALLGKDVLPDDLPWVTGSIGLLGTKPSYDLMMECDTFLMLGSGFPYSEFLPKEGQARGVQVDIEPGDAFDTLPARSQSGRLRQGNHRSVAAADRAEIGHLMARGNRRLEERLDGDDCATARWSRRIRSIRSASSMNFRRVCPTARS